MNLNKRQQLLAILAMVAVGLFIADKIIFTPLLKTWRARSEQIVKLKKDFGEGMELLKREDAWKRQWEMMQKNVLPNSKSDAENRMSRAFDRWSLDSGVSMSSFRPQWKEAQDDFKTLECRADVSGSLSAITKFLYEIERDPMGVKVDSMELQSRDANGSQLALVIQVSGLVLNPSNQTKQ